MQITLSIQLKSEGCDFCPQNFSDSYSNTVSYYFIA